MAKEIRIYWTITDYNADYFMNLLDEAKGEPVTLRINTNGGNPQDEFGMIAKWKEYKGKRLVKVDGKAYSAGALFLCYCDYAEALDVSDFLLHRAAYASWYEKSEYMTQNDWDTLERLNKNLRAALEAKIDVKRFEKLKGVTMDQLFSKDSRIDVKLSADEALAIGLIDKINVITPQISAEINSGVNEEALRIAANYNVKSPEPKTTEQETSKTTIMNLEELKAKHPDVYAQVIAEGKTAGMSDERERIRGWEAFRSIDAEAVNKGIKEGKTISMNDIAEFQAKALNPEALKKLTASAAPIVTTEENKDKELSAKEKEVSAFEAEVSNRLGLKKA